MSGVRVVDGVVREESREPVYIRRSRPFICLLDEDARIGFAEPKALALIANRFETDCESAMRLPFPLDIEVRRIIASWKPGDAPERIISRIPGVNVRVSRLDGPTGSCVALLVERRSCREDLTAAAARFHISKRELQVLTHILRGSSAGEIAAQLCIAETTVNDHFKNLLRKTGARNRSEMIAKVLGWSAAPFG